LAKNRLSDNVGVHAGVAVPRAGAPGDNIGYRGRLYHDLRRTAIFHDFRRTAVRDMVRAGVPEAVAMSISGHKTRPMFNRYNIHDQRDQREALRATQAYREQQAAAQRKKLATLPQKSIGII